MPELPGKRKRPNQSQEADSEKVDGFGQGDSDEDDGSMVTEDDDRSMITEGDDDVFEDADDSQSVAKEKDVDPEGNPGEVTLPIRHGKKGVGDVEDAETLEVTASDDEDAAEKEQQQGDYPLSLYIHSNSRQMSGLKSFS